MPEAGASGGASESAPESAPENRGGRPSFLDDESKAGKQRVKKLIRLLKNGNSLRDACRGAGIPYTCVTRARQRGRTKGAEPRYRTFWQQTSEAIGDSKALLVERWHKASTKHWRAAQALLRARYPEEFAPDLFIAKRLVDDDVVDEDALPAIRVRRQTPEEAEAMRSHKDVDETAGEGA